MPPIFNQKSTDVRGVKQTTTNCQENSTDNEFLTPLPKRAANYVNKTSNSDTPADLPVKRRRGRPKG